MKTNTSNVLASRTFCDKNPWKHPPAKRPNTNICKTPQTCKPPRERQQSLHVPNLKVWGDFLNNVSDLNRQRYTNTASIEKVTLQAQSSLQTQGVKEDNSTHTHDRPPPSAHPHTKTSLTHGTASELQKNMKELACAGTAAWQAQRYAHSGCLLPMPSLCDRVWESQHPSSILISTARK